MHLEDPAPQLLGKAEPSRRGKPTRRHRREMDMNLQTAIQTTDYTEYTDL
jgi:hypothetical protein